MKSDITELSEMAIDFARRISAKVEEVLDRDESYEVGDNPKVEAVLNAADELDAAARELAKDGTANR